MATYNLGQAAIVNKGAWNSSTTYNVLNTVTHNGGTFMAIASNTNKEPGVASDWATYWVPTARGIKNVTVTALSSSQAQVTIVLSDGTSIVGGTYSTAAVDAGSITDTQITTSGISRIANHAVNKNMILSTGENAVLPTNVGFKVGTGEPTAVSTPDSSAAGIAPGQVYLKYTV